MMRRVAGSMVALGVMLLAACGGDEGSSDGGNQPEVDSNATVSVFEDHSLGWILVDSSGAALYTSEQETDGTVRCVASCAAEWPPLTVDSGQKPTANGEVPGALGTVAREDGTTQVTLDGVPLYTFSLDGQPGEVSGNGLSDAFDGTTFTWHVATASGAQVTATPEAPDFRY